jgi:hypothetical protein
MRIVLGVISGRDSAARSAGRIGSLPNADHTYPVGIVEVEIVTGLAVIVAVQLCQTTSTSESVTVSALCRGVGACISEGPSGRRHPEMLLPCTNHIVDESWWMEVKTKNNNKIHLAVTQ